MTGAASLRRNPGKILLALLFAFAFYTVAQVNLKIVMADRPLENRENGHIFTTEALMKGLNPFSFENMPEYGNAYGFSSNVPVIPFAYVAELTGIPVRHSFAVHRGFVMAMNLLSAAMIGFLLFRFGLPLPVAIAFGLVFYNETVGNRALYTSRPDAVSLALFLVSTLALPLLKGFKPKVLFVSVLVAIVAWMAKPQIALAAPLVLTFAYFCMPLKKYLTLGTISVVTFGVAIALVAFFAPAYLHSTVYANGEQPLVWDHLMMQLRRYLMVHAGLIAFFLAGLAWRISRLRETPFTKEELYVWHLQILCFGVFLWLGQNNGSDTYHTTWITPFLLLNTGLLLRPVANVSVPSFAVVAMSLLHLVVNRPLAPYPTESLWSSIEKYSAENGPVLHGMLTAHMANPSHGDEVFDAGYGCILVMGTWNKGNPMREIGIKRLDDLKRYYAEKFKSHAYKTVMIIEGGYLEPFDKKDLEAYYKMESSTPVDAGMLEVNQLQIWRPN